MPSNLHSTDEDTPSIYLGFPKLAQKNVNDSTLEIQSMVLTNPTPHSVDLQQQSVIRSSSPYHPNLDAFNATLSIVDGSSDKPPFASVELPSVRASSDTQVHINQTLPISDVAQFSDFAKVVLASKEYKLAVRGRTGLHQSGLQATTVDYDQVVTLKGMLRPLERRPPPTDYPSVGLNGLKGFNVTSFQILLTTAADGANMVGKVYIPNPSIMTMEMVCLPLSLSLSQINRRGFTNTFRATSR